MGGVGKYETNEAQDSLCQPQQYHSLPTVKQSDTVTSMGVSGNAVDFYSSALSEGRSSLLWRCVVY